MKLLILLTTLLCASSTCFAGYVYTCRGVSGTVTVDPNNSTVYSYEHNWGTTFSPTNEGDWRRVPGGEGRLLAVNDGTGISSLMRVPEPAFQGASRFYMLVLESRRGAFAEARTVERACIRRD